MGDDMDFKTPEPRTVELGVLMRREDLEALKAENDRLRGEVAALRWALKGVRAVTKNSRAWAIADNALAAVPADARGDLQREVAEWAGPTFPHATPDTVLAHLREEVRELSASREAEEAADCLLALCSFATMRGFDLIAEARRKLAINRARTWAPPDADGVSRHVGGT